MIEDIKSYIDKYSDDVQRVFCKLYDLVYDSVSGSIEEKLWAKLPSFYIDTYFVRLIPFKDHINVEASAVNEYIGKLEGFSITPKGMLKIGLTQDIPEEVLKNIFAKTLEPGA